MITDALCVFNRSNAWLPGPGFRQHEMRNHLDVIQMTRRRDDLGREKKPISHDPKRLQPTGSKLTTTGNPEITPKAKIEEFLTDASTQS